MQPMQSRIVSNFKVVHGIDLIGYVTVIIVFYGLFYSIAVHIMTNHHIHSLFNTLSTLSTPRDGYDRDNIARLAMRIHSQPCLFILSNKLN